MLDVNEEVMTKLSARAGADDAPISIDQLFRTQRVPMVRMAYVLTGANFIADEVVQDAFLKVHANWDRIDNPGGYLRTAVVNGCRSYHRHQAVETRINPSFATDGVVSDHDAVLADALAKLSVRKRMALALRYYCDLTDADIALALDVRPATVRSIIHRGLADLRKEIEQ